MAKSKASIRYKNEENRRRAIILAIILLLLGIVMVIYGTFAYYQSTITGNINATIRTWSFKANSSATTFHINLEPSQNTTATYVNTYNETVKTMAPGTSGSFSIELRNDVNPKEQTLPVDYVITFSNFNNKPVNLKFYSDSNFTTETDITANGYSITGTLAASTSETSTVTTKTIYWKWAYGDSSSVTNDNAAADKPVSFDVTVVGTQHQQ